MHHNKGGAGTAQLSVTLHSHSHLLSSTLLFFSDGCMHSTLSFVTHCSLIGHISACLPTCWLTEAVVAVTGPTMMSQEARQMLLSGHGAEGLQMWKVMCFFCWLLGWHLSLHLSSAQMTHQQ